MIRRREALVTMLGSAMLTARATRADDDLVKKLGEMMMKTPITTTRLNESMAMLSGPGGNMAVMIGPDGAILVDSGFVGRGADVLGSARAFAGKPISLLINTHWHIDHCGGNAVVGKSGAKIWATPNARKRLSTDQYTEAFKMTTPATPPEGLPSLTVEEAELHVGGETIHLVSVPPAHTDGDLIVHFKKADVIHTGDLFSKGIYPNIDYSSLGWLGGMVAAAEKILKMAGPNTKIIPGHGPLATAADLSSYRTMLGVIYDRIAPMAASGKSADEVVASAPTKDYDATLGKGFLNGEAFTRLVFEGVVRHHQGK